MNGRSVVRYRILSITGATLQEGRPMNSAIQVDRVPIGVHVLELFDAEGGRTSLRIVKE